MAGLVAAIYGIVAYGFTLVTLLGILLAVWATPAMTVGHLLFSAMIVGYIPVGIQLEERDLIQQFGDQYHRYKLQAAMLIPRRGRKFADPDDTSA